MKADVTDLFMNLLSLSIFDSRKSFMDAVVKVSVPLLVSRKIQYSSRGFYMLKFTVSAARAPL